MRNLEAKFKVIGYDNSWDAIKRVAGLPVQRLRLADQYYQPPPDRIILRTVRVIDPIPDFYYEGVYYQCRASGNLLRLSDYQELDCSRFSFRKNYSGLKVTKDREVFTCNNFRIHLDFVNRLGCFIEVIRLLQADENEIVAQADFWSFTKKLGLSPSDVVDESYIELLR